MGHMPAADDVWKADAGIIVATALLIARVDARAAHNSGDIDQLPPTDYVIQCGRGITGQRLSLPEWQLVNSGHSNVLVALPRRTPVLEGGVVEKVRRVMVLGVRVRVVAQNVQTMREALVELDLQRVVVVITRVAHALQSGCQAKIVRRIVVRQAVELILTWRNVA